jgi:hypothetical protein
MDRFGRAAQSKLVLEKSQEFHEFLHPATQAGKSLSWGEVGESFPLRWASGGFLPIIYFQNKHWALLFFRDIPMIGLNIAIGASETKDEYKDLHHLIGREFSEEVILITAPPVPGSEIFQKMFTTFTSDPSSRSPMAHFINPKFAETHARLRSLHDDVEIAITETDEREICNIRTPFGVRVSYHLLNQTRAETREINNVVYSLNPGEFGIEVIWLCTFQLHTNEYILDGEYHLSRNVLIRRPVVLLDMQFLQKVFSTGNNSLGQLQFSRDTFECKLLPPVPKEHCYIFNQDILLRHRRKAKILALLKDEHQPRKTRDNLVWELDLIEKWLSLYEKSFLEANERGLVDEPLRRLNPVTWKTLELIFAHQIDYRHPL